MLSLLLEDTGKGREGEMDNCYIGSTVLLFAVLILIEPERLVKALAATLNLCRL